MSIEVPTVEPTVITAGDFITWLKSLSDYPATTHTLYYRLIGLAETRLITAVASGTNHLVEIESVSADGPPAVVGSDVFKPGLYEWTSYVIETATSRRTVLETGTLTIKENPTTAKQQDKRSHARKVLAAIEAVIEGTASHEQQSLSIEGKSLTRRSIEELLKLRTVYRAEVATEEAKQDGTNSGGFFGVPFSFGGGA